MPTDIRFIEVSLIAIKNLMGASFDDLVSSQYSGETRPELVEGRWFRQAQPTPPRFFEKIPVDFS
jgi:hypothetical protein